MMIVLLSGVSGAGKTTCCQRVIAEARAGGVSCGGVVCPSVEEGGVKSGSFVVDVSSGEMMPFSRLRGEADFDGIEVGDFLIRPEALAFGVRCISSALANSKWVVVDEVGPLELDGQGFMPAVEELLGSPVNALLSVRASVLSSFRERFSDVDFRVLEVSPDSRDGVCEEIMDLVGDSLELSYETKAVIGKSRKEGPIPLAEVKRRLGLE